MGHQLTEFYLNEAEGGFPEVSRYDIELASIPAFPNNQILPFEPSGATKGSTIFPGIFGPAALGPGSVQPSAIPDYYYFGVFPLGMQPIVDKPNPWER